MNMRTLARWAATPLAVLLLAGCGAPADKAGAEAEAQAKAVPSTKTLAATVQADPDHGALSRLLINAELGGALDGVGPYTLFAPPEAALKTSQADFTDPEMKAESAALLRAHIAPGTLTRADITAAIDRAADKKVEIRNMAGGVLTFTREGEAIVVTAPDGARALLSGEEGLVSNGVLQPVDGLLLTPAVAAG